MSGGNGVIGRSVTSKVTSILDAFRSSEQQLSLAEISARTGMPLSTTHRLANELVRWGGLERVAARHVPRRDAALGDRLAGAAAERPP